MDDALDLIRSTRRLVAFTGAGVSTLSGLPDFRSEDGLYKQLGGSMVFDLAVFQRDPSFFYRHAAPLVYSLGDHEPSIVHSECARLEGAGRLMGVITQNIDMLHQRAGSMNVVELHGSPWTHSCLVCGRTQDYEWARRQVAQHLVPRCPDCRGVIKPDVTFFGEMLPTGAFEQAAAWATEADVMLVLGSSLAVQPAASIPLACLQAGGRLVIVNREPTPLDHRAAARHDDLAEFFSRMAAEV